MKKYYLSKIKQVMDPNIGELVWKHRLQEYVGVEFLVGAIESDPNTGAPVHPAALVLVGGIDHAQFKNDPELIPMPDVAKDTKVSAIHTQTKLKCKADIKGFGFSDESVEAVWNNADGLRDVLSYYGKLNNPAFDPDNFDLDES